MAPARSRLTAALTGLVGIATLTSLVAVPASAEDRAPRAGNGSVAVNFTREDTKSIDVAESFVPPGKTPIVGDFLGDTSDAGLLDDILWYTPGPGGDALWRTTGDRSWVASPTSITGTYTAIPGYFTTSDQKADIFWYAPGSTTDWLWDFNNDGTITTRAYNIGGTYTPIKGYFTDDGAEDIIWYAPGTAADSWWDFDNTEITQRPISVNGTFIPKVASFSGRGSPTFDYIQDILWYAPGSAPDAIWDFNPDTTISKVPLAVNGTYTPVVGDFTHDGFEDVIWYAPGTAKDYLWDFDNATGAKTQTPLTINGTYTPLTGEVFEEGFHQTDIVWFRPGAPADPIWDFENVPDPVIRSANLVGNRTPVLGSFELHTYAAEGGGTSTGAGLDILDRTS